MTVPEGYEVPTEKPDDEIVYYLVQHGGGSATALFMIVELRPGMQSILAEKCYEGHAMQIVDALRGQQEVDHLRRWKSEASEVMMGLQDLGRALGIPPGERITGPLALKYVERLKENQR